MGVSAIPIWGKGKLATSYDDDAVVGCVHHEVVATSRRGGQFLMFYTVAGSAQGVVRGNRTFFPADKSVFRLRS